MAKLSHEAASQNRLTQQSSFRPFCAFQTLNPRHHPPSAPPFDQLCVLFSLVLFCCQKVSLFQLLFPASPWFFIYFPLASLKRSLSSSPSPQQQESDFPAMASSSSVVEDTSVPCPHLSGIKPPRPDQVVHREECTQCFDNQVCILPKSLFVG
jgi:hypothetical protein